VLLLRWLIRRRRPRAFCLLIAAVTVSCAFASPAGVTDVPNLQARSLPVHLGAGYFTGIMWSRSGWLVAGFAANPEAITGSTQEVWAFRANGRDIHQISLPNDPRCQKTEYAAPTSLADGRPALVKTCDLPPERGPVASYALVAYDLETGGTQEILGPQDKVNPGVFSFNPGLDRAIVGTGGDFCSTIAWLTREGPEPIRISMGSGSNSWRLDQAFERSQQQDCTKLGRADLPSWSPDGTQIAFFASPESVGRSGQDRLLPPWDLYLMDAHKLKPHTVTGQVTGPSAPAWSPDSHSISFSATVNGTRGTWILDSRTGRLRGFTRIPAQDIGWSPDGHQIAILHDKSSPSQYPPDIEILLYDVSSLLK